MINERQEESTTTEPASLPQPAPLPQAAPLPPPAPLPRVGLDAALRPFGSSTMLPQEAYVSAAVFDWEQRYLFAGAWSCLGRTAEVRRTAASGRTTGSSPLDEPHDAAESRRADGVRGTITQCARTVGGIGVLITFPSDDDEVRAFANTCRHRAHELLPDGGSNDRRAVVCPYHGWSYDLDGGLRTAPRMGQDFGRRGLGLVELPVVDWHGWLFVNASATAASFAEYVGALDRHVAPYRPEHLVVKARHVYEVAANWKVIAENYHECYHCPQLHPELCAVSPPNSGDNWSEPGAWVGGTMDLREHAETMSIDGRSHGVMLPGAPRRTVNYLGLLPNLLLSLHPDYVLTHRLRPLTPARTVVECEWLFDAAVTSPGYAVDFWDLTNRQDWQACESVQRGLSSPHHVPGPLAPNENAIYDWVTMIARAYRG